MSRVSGVRVKDRGLQELMKSPRMQALLGAKAEAVAAEVEAAGIRVEGKPGRVDIPVTTTVVVGRTRARSRVILDHPAGIAVEAKHGVLTSAIDAARGD